MTNVRCCHSSPHTLRRTPFILFEVFLPVLLGYEIILYIFILLFSLLFFSLLIHLIFLESLNFVEALSEVSGSWPVSIGIGAFFATALSGWNHKQKESSRVQRRAVTLRPRPEDISMADVGMSDRQNSDLRMRAKSLIKTVVSGGR